TLWNPGGGGDILIVSSNQPLKLDYQKQLRFFKDPKIRAELLRIDIHSMEELINHILMSSEQTSSLLKGQQANTDEHPIVEFNAPKHLYTPTVAGNSLMLFGALENSEYRLPFVNLVKEYPDWMRVQFMGIQLKHEGDGYLDPKWQVMRKSLKDEEDEEERYRLVGGMNGEIILNKPWGDVVVHATMVKRGGQVGAILRAMLEYEVPDGEESFAGELRIPGVVVYWRAGPSAEPDKLKVVMAQMCERPSGFDSGVSLFSSFSGDAENKEEVGVAVQQLNRLFRCIPVAN
ncbi:MAG: hypothetical protein GY732_15670, partial [Gammaproteobacteria bacterium]|nr:hypothetical protein [Gammaproteobacteria bacterium]